MSIINIYDVRDIDDDKIIPSGDVLTGPLILTLSLKQTVAKIVHLNTCQVNKRVQFLGSLGVIEHRLRERGPRTCFCLFPAPFREYASTG